MGDIENISKEVLELVKKGSMSKELAFKILKEFNQPKDTTDNDVAIIGMACRFPGANNIEEYWLNIVNGICSIGEFPENRRKDIDILLSESLRNGKDTYTTAGFLENIDMFDAEFFHILPSEAELIEPSQRLFLETAYEAIENAGYGGDKLKGSKTGVYIGVDHANRSEYKRMAGSSDLLAHTGSWTGLIATRLPYVLNLHGPTMVIDSACSSGAVAINTACKALKEKDCSIAIVGGVNLFFTPVGKLPGLESDEKTIRVFDKNAKGTLWGEGIGVVLLKPLRKAIKDRDNIHAVIKGSCVNNNGTSSGITALNGAAQEEVIVNAWNAAKVNPETIAYIEAHATGTLLGDSIEINALDNAFKRFTSKNGICALGTVKPNIGHLVAASGLASLIKVVLAMNHEEMPAIINYSEPNPYVKQDKLAVYINDTKKSWKKSNQPRRAAVSSFSFSGANCHIVLEEAPEIEAEENADNAKPKVLVVSAKSKETLLELVRRYELLLNSGSMNIEDVCYTAATGRGHYSHRLAIVFHRVEELRKKIKSVIATNLDNINEDHVFFKLHTVTTDSSVQRRQMSKEAENIVNQMAEAESQSDRLLINLCTLYINGANINWEELYRNQKRKKVPVPVYPYDRKRHWIKVDTESPGIMKLGAQRDVSENEQVISVEIALTGRNEGEEYSVSEKILSNIWGAVLGLNNVNINDDFSDIGGNSLLAIKIEALAEKQGVNITAEDLGNYRTIRKLAELLDTGRNSVEIEEKQYNEDHRQKFSDQEIDNCQRKKLRNIVPFNDIFYKNCFYNSFFPVIKSYGKSIMPYLLNDLPVYAYSSDSGIDGLYIEYLSSKPIENVLEQEGIILSSKMKSDDILSDIIASISNDKPVIIWVDCFYESIRKDLYQKNHWPHTLLVYGYNQKDRTFDIIEHSYRDNLSYEERTISFSDIEDAYHGFLNHFTQQITQPTYNEFAFLQNQVMETVENQYAVNFVQCNKNNVNELRKGVEALKNYSAKFEEVLTDEGTFFKYGEQLISGLNSIINSREAEKYKLGLLNIDQGNTLIELISLIIDEWLQIRRVVVKSLYAAMFNLDKNKKLLKNYEKIYLYETQYINYINDL